MNLKIETIRELYLLTKELTNNVNLKPEISYKFVSIQKKLEVYVNQFDDERIKIANQYGEKDGDKISIKEEHKETFTNEITKLLQIEEVVELKWFTFESLKDIIMPVCEQNLYNIRLVELMLKLEMIKDITPSKSNYKTQVISLIQMYEQTIQVCQKEIKMGTLIKLIANAISVENQKNAFDLKRVDIMKKYAKENEEGVIEITNEQDKTEFVKDISKEVDNDCEMNLHNFLISDFTQDISTYFIELIDKIGILKED